MLKEKEAPTILFCHENAGNIGLRLPELKKMHSELKVGVVAWCMLVCCMSACFLLQLLHACLLVAACLLQFACCVLQANVLAFDYRGYGFSSGSPSEPGAA